MCEYITGDLINQLEHEYPCLLNSDISDQNKTSKSFWMSHITKDNLKNYPEKHKTY